MWLALLLLAISTSFGQVRNVGNDVVDALERGSRMRAERERLELDKERQNEELRLTRMKTERLRAETEQIKAQTEALQNDVARSSQTAAVQREVDAAIAELRSMYPDSEKYATRMARAAELLVPAATKQLSMKNYLECLYIVAKHATFLGPSGAASERTDGTQTRQVK